MFRVRMTPGAVRLAAVSAFVFLLAVCGSFAAGVVSERRSSGADAQAPPAQDIEGSSVDLLDVELDSVDPQSVQLAFDNFPTTRDGLTYGSDAQAETSKQAPDLVGVYMDSGGLGFVKKVDLYSSPANPQEALALQAELDRNGGVEVLAAYDLEGQQIGTFTSSTTHVSYEPGRR